MTTLLERTRSVVTAPRGGQRPDVVVAAAAGAWAAVLGLIAVTVVVLLGWMFAEHGATSTPDALRGALRVWLGAHRATFDVAGAPVSLLPLGLILLPLGVVVPAGRWLGRVLDLYSPARLGRGVAAFALAYTFVVAALSPLASAGSIVVHPVSAVLWSAVLAAVGAAVGAGRVSGLLEPIWWRVPPAVQVVLVAATAAVAALLAIAALVSAGLLAGSVVVSLDLAARLQPGWVGGLLLFLVGACYLPTLVVWVTAVLVGPGVAVGTGTSVAITGVSLGAVPGFPLLGILPTGPLPRATQALPLVVVAAGVLLGLIARRRTSGAGRWLRLGLVLLAAALAGAGLAVAAALSAGALGAGRMAHLGPAPWWVGALAALELALGGLLATVVTDWRDAGWPLPAGLGRLSRPWLRRRASRSG